MNAKKRYLLLITSIVFLYCCYLVGKSIRPKATDVKAREKINYISLDSLNELISNGHENSHDLESLYTSQDYSACRLETCFNFTRCSNTDLKVYIYPFDVNLGVGESYKKILQAIINSVHYTTDPSAACLFILSLDTLDRDVLSQDFVRNMQSRVDQLTTWNNGENHVIFNLYSGTWPDYTEDLKFNIGKAILAKASIAVENYRPGFDISLPLFHKTHPEIGGDRGFVSTTQFPVTSQFFLAFKGKRYVHGIGSETRNSLFHLHNGKDFALVTTCKHGKNWREMQDDRCEADNSEYDEWDYGNLLTNSTFCLVPRGRRLGSFRFLETLEAGCIPVIMSNGWQLPFGEVIDWTAATVSIDERQLLQVPEILRSIPHAEIFRMRQQTQILWDNYLSSVRKIVWTTLEIMKQRIFPHLSSSFVEWNSSPGVFYSEPFSLSSMRHFDSSGQPSQPFATTSEKSLKFCAVISTASANPVTSSKSPIFLAIREMYESGGLAEVSVLWNSLANPPPVQDWYRFTGVPRNINISLTISGPENKTSKFQVAEACSASQLIFMTDESGGITEEELRYGLSVVAEFQDRMVGFSARTHFWDGDTTPGRWRYSSKPSSSYSLLRLTGGPGAAAFFPRKYAAGYVRAQILPLRKLQLWQSVFPDTEGIPDHCEDLLFNLMVADISHLPPVKLMDEHQHRRLGKMAAPTRNLIRELGELREKDECLNRFVVNEFGGHLPLVSSKLRLDPVLYKDSVSKMRKKFLKLERLR